jgi:hypothetical protein
MNTKNYSINIYISYVKHDKVDFLHLYYPRKTKSFEK